MRRNTPVACSARTYDAWTAELLGELDEVMVERVLETLAGPGRCRVLLDAGAGTGRVLERLAREPALGDTLLMGLEFFADMARAARDTLDGCPAGHRSLSLLGDVHHPPLGPGSADMIISRSTLHHWADPARAMAALFDILAPGGAMIIHDVRRDPAPEALAAFNRLRARGGLPAADLADKYTAAETGAMLAACGLDQWARLTPGRKGMGALGFEVLLRKPRAGTPASHG
jgi:SAM-dependent methyltransferase